MVEHNPVFLFKFNNTKRTGKICGIQTYNHFFMRFQKGLYMPLLMMPQLFVGECEKYHNKLLNRYIKYLFDYSKHVDKIFVLLPKLDVYSVDLIIAGMLYNNSKNIVFNQNVSPQLKNIIGSVVDTLGHKVFSVLFYPEDYMVSMLKDYFDNYVKLLKMFLTSSSKPVKLPISDVDGIVFVDVLTPMNAQKYYFDKFSVADRHVIDSYLIKSYPITKVKFNPYSMFSVIRFNDSVMLCFMGSCNRIYSLDGVDRVKVVAVDKGSEFLNNLLKVYYSAFVRLNGNIEFSEFLKRGCFPIIKQTRLGGKIYALTVLIKDPKEVVEYGCRPLSKRVVLGINDSEFNKRFVILSVPGHYTNIEEVIGSEGNTSDYLIFNRY